MWRLYVLSVAILITLSACRGSGGAALPPLGAPRHVFSVASASVSQWTSGSGFQPASIAVSFAKAPAAGDRLVVVFWNNGQSSGASNTYTPPSGWSLVDQNVGGWYTGYQAFTHVVAAGEANTYAFTPAAAQRTTAWIGADISNGGAVDIARNAYINNSTTWSTPTVTPTQSGDLAVALQLPYNSYTWTNPAGWTVGTGPTPQWHGESVYQQLASTAGVTETSSYSSASYGYAAIVLIAPSGTQTSPSPSPSSSPSTSPAPSPSPTTGPSPPLAGSAPTPVQWTSGSAFQPASITLSFQKSPAPGDRVIVAFWNNGQSSGAANTYTPPSGWNVVDQNPNYYATYQSFSHAVGIGENNAYVFTPAAAQRSHAWIGVDVANAGGVDIAKNAYVDTSTVWSTPSVTPSAGNELALAFQLPYYAYTWTNPTAWALGSGPTPQWHGESLYQQLVTNTPVSETSTYSVASFGFSAIMLLAGSGSQITPTPAPTPMPSPSATPATVDWSTFGFDLERTGYNPNENVIGPSSFGGMHAVWVSAAYVGSGMQGEPVVAMNVNVSGSTRNLLYAGAGSGIFYSIDADTGSVIWQKQLGSNMYTCDTGATSYWGVEGTAAIDRARNRLYVPDGSNKIHALDLATGAEASGWPIAIANVTGNDFIHVAMTYNASNGMLYAETSSTCDISPWYGRITAINTSSGSIVNTFYPEQGTSGGGIWGVGGASIDPSTNNVFIAVGNADNTPETAYYGEQIVELSSDLSSVIAHNYPTNMPVMTDSDFGATPLLFQPVGCPPLLAAVNKSGAFVLYNRTNISAGPVQEITMAGTGDVFRGVPSYDPKTNYVYVGLPDSYGIYSPGVAAFSISAACTLNPTPVWNDLFGSNQDIRSPITIANGVVYVGGYNENTVYAFDAGTGTKLWTGALSGPGQIGPVVVNGRLYVGDKLGYIHAWKP